MLWVSVAEKLPKNYVSVLVSCVTRGDEENRWEPEVAFWDGEVWRQDSLHDLLDGYEEDCAEEPPP